MNAMGMMSYLEDDEVEELIDDLVDNKSAFLKKAVRDKLLDPRMYDERIQAAEQEKRQLIEEKQQIEKEIEQKRDEIVDLKDKRTEMRTLQRVQKKIGMSTIEEVAKRAKQNKYDNDPRALTVESVIEHNAEQIAEENDVDEDKVRQVLKLHIHV